MFARGAEGAEGTEGTEGALATRRSPRYLALMDATAAKLFRRYTLAGVVIASGVLAGSMLARRDHARAFPDREVPTVPCVDACARRASCAGASDDVAARCAVLCAAHASHAPNDALAAARCLLERACADTAGCATSW